MSRNLKIAVGAGVVVGLIALAVWVGPAQAGVLGGLLALTVPPAYAARNSGEQQQHFFRYRLQTNQIAGLSAGVKIGRLPARALVTGVGIHVATSFNSGTSDAIQLGTTNGGADILAAAQGSVHGAPGYTNVATVAGIGLTVTGSGEVDIWAKYTQSGAAATAGDATLVLTYIPDNDQ